LTNINWDTRLATFILIVGEAARMLTRNTNEGGVNKKKAVGDCRPQGQFCEELKRVGEAG
jgi:hypothetical protein